MLKKLFRFFSKSKTQKYLLIFLGMVSWSLVMVRSGLCWDKNCNGGLGFWGANGHDGIWHIALIESLANGNFQSPIFAGWGIQNYHIGFDLLMSWIVRLTGVSASILYFQIIPPILALSTGLLTYKFVNDWKKSEKAAWWATFFVYFGGSWGWLMSLIRGQGWGGESMFWSQQSISTLINPPFALSLIIIIAALIYLQKLLKRGGRLNFLIAAVFFGTVIFVKVYAGLLVLAALFTSAIWQMVKQKKFNLMVLFIATSAISFLLFIPFNKSSIGMISLSPFWFLETMVGLSDRLYWPKLFSAMTTYKMGHMWIKGFGAYLLAFVIFMIGNFGTRVVVIKAFIDKPKKILSADILSVFLFTVIICGTIIPIFFVQKGTPWNTIQFFYYSLMFAGVGAGITLGKLVNRRKLFLVKLLFLIFTIPTTVASLTNYLPLRPQSILPASEVEALNFLSQEQRGTVLTYPFDAIKANLAIAPRPLYLYASTSYVSAFSKQIVFLEDEINLDIMQYPWIERRETIESFLNTLNIDIAYKYLRDNGIKYVYWLTDQHAREGDKQLGMTRIFQNKTVTIFRVD